LLQKSLTSKKKTDTGCAVDVVDKSCADGTDTETERNGGYESARANLLAGHSRRDFEENVGDVKDREDSVVVVSPKMEVFLETGKSCITWKMVC
jgi:hypothetical protein